MDNKELADGLREILTPEVWWSGDEPYQPGKHCLGTATGAYYQSLGRYNGVRIEQTIAATRRLLEIIEDLFPGRAVSNGLPVPNIPAFNDHPDTTYEDVLLVIKHLGSE